jgi:divalent metal cation (Fe/Co/Zn/Cd) transporter
MSTTSATPARLHAPLATGGPEWVRQAKRARLVSWLSLGAMTLEGVIAVVAGIIAGSIALIGFGIDSAIEGVASVVIIWRFAASRRTSERAERRAQRLVAVQFFLLAPYITFEALRSLIGGDHPDVSWLGIGLSIGSLVAMPALGIAKQRIAHRIGSPALHAEGTQNLICAYLAATLLVGLLANAVVGWWWADPVAALVIAALALREGVESWRGEGCCVAAPLGSDEAHG